MGTWGDIACSIFEVLSISRVDITGFASENIASSNNYTTWFVKDVLAGRSLQRGVQINNYLPNIRTNRNTYPSPLV